MCVRETQDAAPATLPPDPVAYLRLKGTGYPDEARDALLALLRREGRERDVFAFARHKDVPPDDPHTGVGLARWLAAAAVSAAIEAEIVPGLRLAEVAEHPRAAGAQARDLVDQRVWMGAARKRAPLPGPAAV